MTSESNYQEFAEVMQPVKFLPCVSLIFPFEPKMRTKEELQIRLKNMLEKVDDELLKNYDQEKSVPVMLKIHTALKTLNFSTHKKSVALFVSPVVEKIYYLDIPVVEKIIIDDSFEIRDLVYSKKEVHKYYLLVLSKEHAKTFLGNTNDFIKVASIDEVNQIDHSEKVANFSDTDQIQQVAVEKFLHHVDNTLTLLLKSTSLPVFVLGDDKTSGHFKAITHNSEHIIHYLHGNFEKATETELREKVAPFVQDWKSIKQHELLQHLDAAKSAGKLSVGIEEVWKNADSKRGRLLIVEKNYMYHPRCVTESDMRTAEHDGGVFFIRDTVDDVIEKVLANGGDVEFVDLGILDNYEHIALIQYY